MGKHQPYENMNKFLITERSLNYILRPVQVRKDKYPYTYNIENMGSKVAITADKAWTSSNHIVLDFIGHELFEKEYKEVKKRSTWRNDLSRSLLYKYKDLLDLKDLAIPPDLRPYIKMYEEYHALKIKSKELTNLRDTLDPEEYEKLQKNFSSSDRRMFELHSQIGFQNFCRFESFYQRRNSMKFYIIEFNRYKFLDRYKHFFKNRRGEYLTELIKRTSEVTFSLEYPIRTPVIEKYDNKGEPGSKIVGVCPETVRIENGKLFNYKIENDKIKIAFNTFFGRAYAHNLLTLNTDWFEENFLNLDGYASAIYRHFFVTRSGNKVDQLPIKHIIEYFDLLNNGKYPEVIKNAFEDIKKAGLIADYEFKNNGGKFSKGWIEVKK